MRLTIAGKIKVVPVMAAVVLGAASLPATMKEAYAGPFDARTVTCRPNTGGTTNKGNRYAAYQSGYGVRLSAGRTHMPVPAEATRGTVLFSTTETALPTLYGESQGLAAPLYYCPPGTIEKFDGNGIYIDSTHKLYSTGVPGIGYRVYYYINGSEQIAAPASFSNPYQTGALVFPLNGSGQSGYLTTRIDFVATGDPIRPGVIRASQIYGQASVPNAGIAIPGQLYRVTLMQDITISVPTCNVINPTALTMTLPDVSTTQIVGGQATRMTETNLQVSCSTASRAAPSLKITANSQVAGQVATLRNQDTGATGAKGVGVQLSLWDPSIGNFRAPVMGRDETNVGMAVGALPTYQWSYRLGANYRQVEPTVQAGAVRASATLTFTYM